MIKSVYTNVLPQASPKCVRTTKFIFPARPILDRDGQNVFMPFPILDEPEYAPKCKVMLTKWHVKSRRC